MVAVAAEQELLKACQVIFGADLNVSRQFLEYLQLSGIKSAYRQRAKESHPDLLASESELVRARGARQFQLVKQAYDHLKVYVSAREKGFRFATPQRHSQFNRRPSQPSGSQRQHEQKRQQQWQQWQRQRQQTARRQAASRSSSRVQAQQRARQARSRSQKTTRLFKGELPQRPMLFGHFLYYSGLIDWQTLVKALIWQRTHRPRIGEIGKRLGWLSDKDILSILQSNRSGKMFGQTALERGKLTASQLRMILASQKAQQKRIGDYFVQQQIISRPKMQELLQHFQAHNAKQNRLRRKAS